MAISKEEILEAVGAMTVMELNDLVKAFEEKFGVSAAALAVAAPGAAGALGHGGGHLRRHGGGDGAGVAPVHPGELRCGVPVPLCGRRQRRLAVVPAPSAVVERQVPGPRRGRRGSAEAEVKDLESVIGSPFGGAGTAKP